MCSGGDPRSESGDPHRDGFYRNDLHPGTSGLDPKVSRPNWLAVLRRLALIGAVS